MGIVYYLAREDNRTLFEIGKLSTLSDLFLELGTGNAARRDWLPREVPSAADLAVLIRVAIDGCAFSLDRDTYATELARRVVEFADGHPVLVLNDASSDETMSDQYTNDAGELRIVGSAYSSEW